MIARLDSKYPVNSKQTTTFVVIFISIATWLIASVIDSLFFNEGSLSATILFPSSLHIYVRLIIIFSVTMVYFVLVQIYSIKVDQELLYNRIEVEKNKSALERLEVAGRLANGMAHDMNNILGAISLQIESLKYKTLFDNELQTAYQHILTLTGRGAGICRNLLSFYHAQRQYFYPIDTHSVICSLVKNHQEMFQYRLKINLQLNAENHMVNCESTRLENALINLLLNAQDAMKLQGDVIIRTYNVDKKFPNINNNFQSDTQKEMQPLLCIEVKDFGIGMDSEQLNSLFEPFFTTRQKEGRGGLGMTCILGFLESSGGFIEVKSEPQQGTSFFLHLPLALGAEIKAKKTVVINAKNHSDKKINRVLLLDDDNPLRTIIRKQLVANNYEVDEASNGIEGVELFLKQKEHYDVVIIDMKMPKMNGREVYDEIKKVQPNTAIIMISGNFSHEDVQYFSQQEILGTLEKPFSFNALLNLLNKAK